MGDPVRFGRDPTWAMILIWTVGRVGRLLECWNDD
jgi:hypothetical protein